MADRHLSGILYVVGTPIGNLQDMTFRAVEILQFVDVIAAEDTRHTGKLLHHFQIQTPQISYHQHNQKQRLEELLHRLREGENIALVSDAGMPGISDPGFGLVQGCVDAQIQVIPIPGVSAGITALVASGLSTDRFGFEGFLPSKGKDRKQRLNYITQDSRTLILYESPHRLRQTLEDCATVLGQDRKIAIARELTKIHEEFWRGTLGEAQSLYQDREPKGEYTLIIAGKKEDTPLIVSEAELKTELIQLIAQGMTRSQASRHLAKLSNLPRRQIYQLLDE